MYVNIIGPDGSGKNTQEELLFPYFPNAIITREPGGTTEAEIIRDVILNQEYTDTERMSKLQQVKENPNTNSTTKKLLEKAIAEIQKDTINGTAEMFLYTASRSESLEKVIRPSIEKGTHILGNRSVACSIAYQGNARGIGMEKVWKVNEPVVSGTYPDLEIFLDIPVSVTTERIAQRTEKQDRLDQESIAFHEKSREGYLTFYEEICPYNYAIIDATGSIEEVHQNILDVLVKNQVIEVQKSHT